MKKVITVLVLVLIGSLTITGCPGVGESPSDVAKAFYKAGNEGDYEKAFSYLSIHIQMAYKMPGAGLVFGKFDNAMDGVTKNGTIKRIEVEGGEEFPGGHQAVIYVTLHYADGDKKQDVLTLQKEDGRWKIIMSILLATGAYK